MVDDDTVDDDIGDDDTDDDIDDDDTTPIEPLRRSSATAVGSRRPRSSARSPVIPSRSTTAR
jgi:hypothetical protein